MPRTYETGIRQLVDNIDSPGHEGYKDAANDYDGDAGAVHVED